MLELGKNGKGFIRGILSFPCDDHYRPSNATWARDLCAFSGCLMNKTRENQQNKHNMTQVASLLALATVLMGLWALNIYILQSGRLASMRDKTTYAGTRAKSAGGLCTRVGSIIAGFCSTCSSH